MDSDGILRFCHCKQLTPTQTKDFTKFLCFQDIDPHCQVEELTHLWTWTDYVMKQHSATLFDFVYLVRGTDKLMAEMHGTIAC